MKNATMKLVDLGNGKASARLSSLVTETAQERGMSADQALICVLATEEGAALWEEKRVEDLKASKFRRPDFNGATSLLLHAIVRQMTLDDRLTAEQAFNLVVARKEGAALFQASRLEEIEASRFQFCATDERKAATVLLFQTLVREMSKDQKMTADQASNRLLAVKQGKAL